MTPMADFDSFCLFLCDVRDNVPRLQVFAQGLRQGEASQRAAQYPIEPNSIWMVGSAGTRSVGIYLPTSAHSFPSALLRRVVLNRLQGWIDWLRASAVIRFGDLSDASPPQVVPDRYVRDREVRAFFGLASLALHPIDTFHGRLLLTTPDELIATAPARSIAGLLRDSPMGSLFSQWLAQRKQSNWLQVAIPLFNLTSPVEASASGLRCGIAFWSTARRESDQVWGQMTHLTIDDRGWVAHQDYPIDSSGVNWTPPDQDVSLRPVDPAFRSVKDLSLAGLLDHLPTLVEQVLYSAPASANEPERLPGAYCLHHLAAAYIRAQIAAECLKINHQVRENAFPGDGSAPTVQISRYLYATGEGDLQRRRIDAFKAFPSALWEVAHGRMPSTSTAIDLGRPLFRTISEESGSPLWAVRRCQRILADASNHCVPDLIDLATLLRLLTDLGPLTPEPNETALRCLLRLVKLHPTVFQPGVAPGWRFTVLVRSAGRHAQAKGWQAAAEAITDIQRTDGIYSILDYWDVMRDNIDDVLERYVLDSDPVDIVTPTLQAWLADTTLGRLHILSARLYHLVWERDRPVCAVSKKEAVSIDAESLFERFSLLDSRIEVQPLVTKEDLVREAQEMHHCVASYAATVAWHRLLVVSLTCATTGQRATLSLFLTPNGGWKRHELKGPVNASIAADSPFEKGARELAAYLRDASNTLNSVILERYRVQAAARSTVREHFEHGRQILSALPEALQRLAEPCFPGAGSIDSRVLRAFRSHARKASETHDGTQSG